MSDNKSGDWPLVVLMLGVLAFVAAMVISGHKEALWFLFVLAALFFV